MRCFSVGCEALVEGLLPAGHLAAVALDPRLHGAVAVEDRQRAAQSLQATTLQKFHLYLFLIYQTTTLYPNKLLDVIVMQTLVKQLSVLFLYIAVGCMNMPFLFE